MKENFKRRCSLLVEQVEEKRHLEKQEKDEHCRNVERRTSQVQAQRRKSQGKQSGEGQGKGEGGGRGSAEQANEPIGGSEKEKSR